MRLTFGRGDALAIAFVAGLTAASGFAFASSLSLKGWEGEGIVRIYREGELVRELSLGRDQTLTVEGEYRNVIQVLDKAVSFAESDCPGEDCVHSGALTEPGRSLVCLPNRVEVRIEGESGLDVILR